MGRDQAAAQEMVRLSGQRGVPVTVINGTPVVGFDRPRLETLLNAAQAQSGPAQPQSGSGQPQSGPVHPSLGAAVADASVMAAQGRCAVSRGAYVGRVTPDGIAARAGLQVGDVLLTLAGQPLANAAALEKLWVRLHPGHRVPLTLVRGGQEYQLTLEM